jgi:hypothetical protein
MSISGSAEKSSTRSNFAGVAVDAGAEGDVRSFAIVTLNSPR